MRRWAFIIAVLGIFVLIVFMVFGGVGEVDEAGDLDGLVENSKVRVLGVVQGERGWGEDVLLVLDNGVEVVVDGSVGFGLKGKEVEVIGVVEEWEGKRVRALKVFIE
jgi:hypothetical protein